MSDPYAGIFDHLDPDDFAIESTAEISVNGSFIGPDAFESFVNDQVGGLRLAWATSGGVVRPMAMLCSPTVRQLFTMAEHESYREFLARLTREASTLRAQWMFFAFETTVCPLPPGESIPADSPQARALADNMQPKMVWYAEARYDDEAINRIGVMTIEGNRLEMAHDVYDQPIENFSSVLEGR